MQSSTTDNPITITFNIADESAMVALGQQLAQATGGQGVVFLKGDLGMGKTTLSRGILYGFGHSGAVKSPTYTLVEPYELSESKVYHFDLYRLSDPEELEFMGIRDYFDAEALCLIEWPDKGRGILPAADIEISISRDGLGRQVELMSGSALGRQILNDFDYTDK